MLALAIEHGGATTRAVRSHTGALASDGAAIDAACRAAGVQRVHTPRELVDAAQALLRCTPARGRRMGVLADGGGHGSIAAALAARDGFELPELSPASPLRCAHSFPPARRSPTRSTSPVAPSATCTPSTASRSSCWARTSSTPC